MSECQIMYGTEWDGEEPTWIEAVHIVMEPFGPNGLKIAILYKFKGVEKMKNITDNMREPRKVLGMIALLTRMHGELAEKKSPDEMCKLFFNGEQGTTAEVRTKVENMVNSVNKVDLPAADTNANPKK